MGSTTVEIHCAVQELPDVLLSDCGGLLDHGCWKQTEEPSVIN